MFFAASHTDYHIPSDIQPQVVYASHSYFVNRFCDGVESVALPCDTVGIYIRGKFTIYIDITKTTGEKKNSFIVHELTHFLQDTNHKYEGSSCTAARAREDEAYRIENEYGLAHGVPYNAPASDEDILCDHTIKS